MNSNASYAILLVAVVIILTLGLSYYFHRRRLQAWREVADRTGMSLHEGNFFYDTPYISGVYRGFQSVVETYTRGSGKHRSTYMRVRLTLRAPSAVTLQLTSENLFSKMGKALGMQDIEVGDAELDQRFIIKGQPESEVIRILSAIGLRQKLLEMRYASIEVQNQEVVYHRQGVESNPEAIVFLLDVLSDLAAAIEKPM